MKSDIEIAQSICLENIEQIAQSVQIPTDKLIQYGKYIAKVPIECIDNEAVKKHKLILVTSISPTEAGIGKTTVSIGLALGLHAIGEKTIVALREPSLGPCFGKKEEPQEADMPKYCPWKISISTSPETSMPSPRHTICYRPCSTTSFTFARKTDCPC